MVNFEPAHTTKQLTRASTQIGTALHKYKINLMKTLFHRAFNICSDTDLFKEDAAFIKNNLLKNQFPAKLVDSVLANFVEKISHGSNNDSEEIPTVGKMEVFLILPYLGESSLRFE